MNFEKSDHAALWGSESWEISAHPSDPSVIAGGQKKGYRLDEIYPNGRIKIDGSRSDWLFGITPKMADLPEFDSSGREISSVIRSADFNVFAG